MRTEWDIAGRCQAPVTVEMWVRPAPRHRLWLDKSDRQAIDAIKAYWPGAAITAMRISDTKRGQGKHITVSPGTAHPVGVTLHTKCRKCAACLQARELLWRSRALQEIRVGTRNWFGTLTLNPTEQALARSRAISRATRQGTVFETLKDSEQFRAVVREINPLITRWLKRVRKESESRFRYLLVTEAHETGLPHFHLLLHERGGAVTKRTLQAQWGHGFSSFKLIPDDEEKKAGRYVCKYIGKSSLARVRASGHYGTHSLHNVSVTPKNLVDLPGVLAGLSGRGASEPAFQLEQPGTEIMR